MQLTFGQALDHLKEGDRVSRAGWNGKDMWLKLVEGYQVGPDKHVLGRRLLPWIGMKTADGSFVPWLASQTDLLAEDWVLWE